MDRRIMLCWVVMTSCGALSAAELTDTRHSPHAVVYPVRLDEVRWTDGFWADRFATCRTRSVPAMWELMKGTKYKPFYQHFLIAAGKADGDYHGAPWNDGDFYKWLEAACAVWAVTQDADLAQAIDQAIEAIGGAQREDGYLHTPVLIRQRNGDASAQPFQDRHQFEMYNMGHLLTAACIHYRVTGRDELLKIARKAADFLCTSFQHPSSDRARHAVCPAHYMGIVELYRTTREPRYLELARSFLTMRDLVQDGGDDNQDRIPFLQQREAVGHAVRANYLYAGAADLYAETGDEELWIPLEAIWHNVVQKKMYITGGCGALYDGASPDGSADQESIRRVHQAYGRNYQLPSITAHNETCASIGNVLWNWRMFLVTGEARYIDVVELALYNSVLSGVSLEGSDYFYVNPLRHVEPLPAELRWPRTRVPFVVSFCCPPNVVRTVAEVNGYAYSQSAGTLWVNLYGGNTLHTTVGDEPLQLRQQTQYPWDGTVRLLITQAPAAAFHVRLRIPGWAEEARVLVNGQAAEATPTAGQYCDIHRKWNAGDELELRLPMPARLIEAHPLVEETRQQVAIQRGPVVYCLESPDLPQGVGLEQVLVPARVELVPRFREDVLEGVVTLQATLWKRPPADWSSTLYRPLKGVSLQEIEVELIPYYAWSNRGPSEMSVWLPVGMGP